MSKPNNGQTMTLLNSEAAQGFTAERVLRPARNYSGYCAAIGRPSRQRESNRQFHRVSTHTVRAIRHREGQDIAERKKTLAAMLANVAELGAGRMEETIGKAGLRDAAIGTGIAVDKMLALMGQTPAVQIANIVLPTEEERAERRRLHDQLDAITRRLRERHRAADAGV